MLRDIKNKTKRINIQSRLGLKSLPPFYKCSVCSLTNHPDHFMPASNLEDMAGFKSISILYQFLLKHSKDLRQPPV